MTDASIHNTPVAHVPLSHEVDLQNAGGILFNADMNNDGQQELLILQTPGLFHAAIHGSSNNLGHDHFCLTAIKQDGSILWRIGSPWADAKPYQSHGGERSLVTCDLDNDGKLEVYVIRGSSILKINAKTGGIQDTWPLPYDNFVALCAARTGDANGSSNVMQLLASPANQSYDNHSHGGPTLIFNAQGQVQFQKDIHGFGHDPVAFDLNDDGRDEWLAGYELLNHQGEQLWRFDPVPAADFDDMEMHVDGLSLHLDGPAQNRRIAYAASTFVFVLDVLGKLIWSHELVHPQQVIYAKLLPDSNEPQLLVVNKRDALQLFDFNGKLLWTRDPQECWPHGKTPGVKQKFHLFDPCLKLHNVRPGGLDAIVYMEGGWPYGFDGTGERVLEFECPKSSAQPAVAPCRRPDDFGAGYVGRVFEEQGNQCLIIGDRRRLWLYKMPITRSGGRACV